MSLSVLLNRSAIYRKNNFIYVGEFKKNPIYMGIDKLSFVSDIDSDLDYSLIYERLDFLLKEKDKNYSVSKARDKHYRKCIKIICNKKTEFYMLISYDFLRRKGKQSVRFELSPQYGEIDSIYQILEWLKDGIGEETVQYLLKRARVTRIDITADIYADTFIKDYYFSIPDARTGSKFINNDDCKNNYCVGSNRSEHYLLVYEKVKLLSEELVDKDRLIYVKEKHIQKRITRLEFRLKPRTPIFLSKITRLDNPFARVIVYSEKKVNRYFNDFLPFLRNEKSIPIALNRYLKEKGSFTRYEKSKIKEVLDGCRSRHSLDIDWKKWQDILRVLNPLL